MLSGKQEADVAMARGVPTQDEYIKALLARRGDALALLKQARDAEDLKEAKEFQTLVRELEKLLARQGVKFDA